MKLIKKLILSTVVLISYTYCFSQNDVAKAMLELDERLTNYDILKIDTQYYDTGEIHKIYYYDTNNKLRKTIVFYKSGAFQIITNRNTKDESDGLFLEFYENGTLKNYGIYINGVGFLYSYYENGKIKEYYLSKGPYCAWYGISYCENGQKELEQFYDSLSYTQQAYYCDGSLKFKGVVINRKNEEGSFLKGLPDGKWVFWHKNGKIRKEIYFEKSKILKTVKYDEEGVLYFEKEEKEPVEVLFHEGYVLGELGEIYN